MLVTEEQAKEIECQNRTRNALLQAIAAGERPSSAGQDDWSVGCIASKCMWWRWDEPAPNRHGWCGLAGKP